MTSVTLSAGWRVALPSGTAHSGQYTCATRATRFHPRDAERGIARIDRSEILFDAFRFVSGGLYDRGILNDLCHDAAMYPSRRDPASESGRERILKTYSFSFPHWYSHPNKLQFYIW